MLSLTSSFFSKAPFSQTPTQSYNFKDHEVPLSEDNHHHLLNEVLNHFYKMPFPSPSEVTIRGLSGKTLNWNKLPYLEKKSIISRYQRGKCASLFVNYEGPQFCKAHVPRWSHGLMHATRVTLLVRMLANMYMAYSAIRLSEKEILLAQYLAVFHDSARQSEGVDVWDDESAENALPYLLKQGFSEKRAKECVQIIKDKDSSCPNKHIISKLIQSADALDIMRIYGLNGFKNEHLDIFKDLSYNSNFCFELEKLKEQFYLFIEKTEQGLFKVYQEKYSKNYFQEILFLMLLEGPLLQSWYKKEAKNFSSETLEVVFNAPKDPNFGPYYMLKKIYGGTHKAYLLADSNAKLHFFKEVPKEDADFEIFGSEIASEITDGDSPLAEFVCIEGREGLLQNYISFEGASEIDQPETLNLDQKIQLFAHMIADYIIYNYDTHSLQFGIDSKGRVRSIDKGEAFRPFRKNSLFSAKGVNLDLFDPNYWPDEYIGTPTYKFFCAHLKQSPDLSKKIINSKEIQEAFQRVKMLSFSSNRRDQFSFIDHLFKRAENTEERIQKFFT